MQCCLKMVMVEVQRCYLQVVREVQEVQERLVELVELQELKKLEEQRWEVGRLVGCWVVRQVDQLEVPREDLLAQALER